ncbi:MAG TPA: hypothetical protein VIY69_18130 [Candidatus Acidoferrales bacterium]
MEQQVPQESRLKTTYKILSCAALACVFLIILVVLHKSPPPVVTTNPTAAARAQQKFTAADEAKSEGQPAQVQLDSTELNSFLAQSLQMSVSGAANASDGPAGDPSGADTVPSTPVASASPAGLPDANGQEPSLEDVQSAVRDVKVDMDGDLIKAYVIFNLHGEDLSLELDGHLGSENGYMKFEPVSGKLGSLPLPQSVLDAAVDQLMNSPENKEKLRLPDNVSDIQVQDGHAVVSYK